MAPQSPADEPLPTPSVVVDEKHSQDRRPQSMRVPTPTSPPGSAHSSPEMRKASTAGDYYASRPRFDRLGNPIPEHRRRPSAMSSVYGSGQVLLPGDLGPNDPRRPRSPAPQSLPGDLGPNDPRRPRSAQSSPASSNRERAASDPLESKEGARVQKDPPPLADSSSSDDEDGGNENDGEGESSRGRGRVRPEPGLTTSGKSVNVRSDSEDSIREGQMSNYTEPVTIGTKPDPTKGESMLSVRAAQRTARARKRVHPSTAFDAPPKSGLGTPQTSDEEHQAEIKAAQKLSLTMSQVHSTPSAHRVIVQIIRGDYAYFQREAEEGRKRQRMYLVATDLSPEAEYALEWTIGTVLRDGDTLFAVYAVDLETAGTEDGVEIGHGAESVRDTAAIVRTLTNEPSRGLQPPTSPLALSAPSNEGAAGRSRSRGLYSSAETERRRALDDISQRCIRLLRKTRLQVRVVVEVFHCKSPRHMITEVIDFLSPTLVVIGSRGQSAVKGVLLGSFSNYLVTKSSVPVMVARKKLRKHGKGERKINRDGTSVPYSGSGRTSIMRLSNVIEAPRKGGLRVKGWDAVGID